MLFRSPESQRPRRRFGVYVDRSVPVVDQHEIDKFGDGRILRQLAIGRRERVRPDAFDRKPGAYPCVVERRRDLTYAAPDADDIFAVFDDLCAVISALFCARTDRRIERQPLPFADFEPAKIGRGERDVTTSAEIGRASCRERV